MMDEEEKKNANKVDIRATSPPPLTDYEIPYVDRELHEADSPDSTASKFWETDAKNMKLDFWRHEEESIGDMLRKSFWQINIVLTGLAFFGLILGIISMNATDSLTINLSQAALAGEKVRTTLSIISPTTHKASLVFVSGREDKVKVLSMALSDDGEFEMTRDWDVYGSDPVFVLDEEGDLILSNNVDMGGRLTASSIGTTGSDGISFPDGTRMTSAAKVLHGISSDTDLNLAAGVNSSASSMIFSVDKQERARISKDGIYFRDQDLTDLDSGIAFYPNDKSVTLGDGDGAGMRIWDGGVSKDRGEGMIELQGSETLLNSTTGDHFLLSSKTGLEIKAVGTLTLGASPTDAVQIGNSEATTTLQCDTLSANSTTFTLEAKDSVHLNAAGTGLISLADGTVSIESSSNNSLLSLQANSLTVAADQVSVEGKEISIGASNGLVTLQASEVALQEFSVVDSAPASLVYSSHATAQTLALNLSLAGGNLTSAPSGAFSYAALAYTLRPSAAAAAWSGDRGCALCLPFAAAAANGSGTPALVALQLEGAALALYDGAGAAVAGAAGQGVAGAVVACEAVAAAGGAAAAAAFSTFFPVELLGGAAAAVGLGLGVGGQGLVDLAGGDELGLQCAVTVVEEGGGAAAAPTGSPTASPTNTTPAPTLEAVSVARAVLKADRLSFSLLVL